MPIGDSRDEIREAKFERRDSRDEIREARFERRNSRDEFRETKFERRNSRGEIRESRGEKRDVCSEARCLISSLESRLSNLESAMCSVNREPGSVGVGRPLPIGESRGEKRDVRSEARRLISYLGRTTFQSGAARSVLHPCPLTEDRRSPSMRKSRESRSFVRSHNSQTPDGATARMYPEPQPIE